MDILIIHSAYINLIMHGIWVRTMYISLDDCIMHDVLRAMGI